ncbi:LTA synthase family protein [Clostridium intestinale]|uniref:LTA synthase family protein n=1 Tax=Clostridium intestinale TaxID=36845 RepID=UPI0028E52C52|nr:LTA synthase family protein [Clostridium intestinale]
MQDIVYKELFNPFKENLINFKLVDVLFWVDIVTIILCLKGNRYPILRRKSITKSIILLTCSLTTIFLYHYLIDIKDITKGEEKLFKVEWAPRIMMGNMGPVAYHLYEIDTTISKLKTKRDNNDIQDVEAWLKDNREDLVDNEYKGIFKGKNIIFLQVESLENFVLNQKVYGQEITPNLNKLIQKSYYFNNIFEQNNAGNSIDCDMMINTSTFPLGDSITFLTHPEVEYNSLPVVLKKNGYYTVSTHAEKKQDWNWGKAHNMALKFNEKWDISQYDVDEYVGFGLSDRSFLTQFHSKLTTLPQPFYAILPTLSSHGPFDIADKYRKLNLPKEIDENYLGGYFQSVHYTDKQIDLFINLLEKSGLMKNSVLVIYGDHCGVHKYYNDDIQDMQLEGNWWQGYDRKIPLIIYSEGIDAKKIEAHGGQVDIMPTMAYLLGIDDEDYRNTVMGRVLVNTNIDATVIKGNTIMGNVKNEEEKSHLLKAYDIGEKIIKNNYFSK